MKKRIKFLGIISAFAFVVVSAISINSFANVENPAERYDTDACIYHDPNGSSTIGSKCVTPKDLGPCTKTSDCIPASN